MDILPPPPFSAMPLNTAPVRVAALPAPPTNFPSQPTASLNPWALGLGLAALPMVPIVVTMLVMLAPVRWLMSAPPYSTPSR